MKRIVTTRQMKESDMATIQKIGIPSVVLMERAALAVKNAILTGNFLLDRILILCGSGNNGGDGIAIGRMLHLEGYQVDIYVLENPEKRSEDHIIQYEIAKNCGTNFVYNPNPNEYTTIVDSIFGIGLSRNVSNEYQILFEKVNQSKASVIAVDIPSGIDGNTGQILGEAIRADMTVTFAFAKPGLLFDPGAAYAGEVRVCDIGIYEHPSVDYSPQIYQTDETDLIKIPKRNAMGNKGTFGKVLLIAGSYCMSGACYLAGASCLRTGAGMLKIFTVESNREILQQQLPEAMLSCYSEDGFEKETLHQAMEWADVVGIGPGIGQSEIAKEILNEVLKYNNKPLLIDADGLNLLSKQMDLLKEYRFPSVVTPHMGEMKRLTGVSIDELRKKRLDIAGDFAEKYQTVCVLKDARTVIAKNNLHYYINTTGNSGMATAGSGDVLSGVILGLMAQGMSCEEAAYLGVWLHGKAGDHAKDVWGEYSMKAGDLITSLSMIMKEGL